MNNKEEEHKEHMRKELKRIGQKIPKIKEEPKYQPTQSDYYELWENSITNEERIEFRNIQQSKAFFNKPFPNINWEEECIKRGFA